MYEKIYIVFTVIFAITYIILMIHTFRQGLYEQTVGFLILMILTQSILFFVTYTLQERPPTIMYDIVFDGQKITADYYYIKNNNLEVSANGQTTNYKLKDDSSFNVILRKNYYDITIKNTQEKYLKVTKYDVSRFGTTLYFENKPSIELQTTDIGIKSYLE